MKIVMRMSGGCRALVVGAWLGLMLPGFLAGCGGGGGSDGPAYALVIDQPPSPSTTLSEVMLTGEGFLPPGSTCGGGCTGLLPPPVFGQLGPYTLRWHNEATDAAGVLSLSWICNCGGSAPGWIARVPLAPGVNRISVTMVAGGYSQAASVTLTRE